ncbi:molybdopterin-dependent oxidoreductase [Streptomyces sp. NPDC093097]|uniref:molybdopterin-dependent oxidoreductase n=1 Tax=Streptomyces sp. NPDC093097 TaxID=3366027 RepID=UPI003804AAB2
MSASDRSDCNEFSDDGARKLPPTARYSRRGFLELSAAGAATAGMGAYVTLGASRPSDAATPSSAEKEELVDQATPARYFVRRENGSYEMKWGPVGAAAVSGDPSLRYGDTIPNDRSYIHNRAKPPAIGVKTWRLRLTGDALTRPRSFTYAELSAMPQVTLRRTLDCGANCASFFPKLPPSGAGHQWLPEGFTQWHFGAVTAAEWTGVRVKDVLAAAGAHGAVEVKFIGLDEISSPGDPGGTVHYSQVVRAEEALKDDTLLVYRMNGTALSADHGYPVRVLFSGWGGNHMVKWLGEIQASKRSIPITGPAKNQVLVGPDYPTPVRPTVAPVRSAVEHDPERTLMPGNHTLYGRAWSGTGSVDRVDVTVEQLLRPQTWTTVIPWREAKLLSTPEPLMWVRFALPWQNVRPGYYRIMTRAKDTAGNIQPRPEDVVWNQHGLGYNGHHPLELIVLPTGDMP